MRYLVCALAVALGGGCVAAAVAGQQTQAGEQEGVQPQNQNMTPAQRAVATRSFLGLGAVPDKVAAARGTPLYLDNCAFCHGQDSRGATAPSLITSDLVLSDDHGERLVPFLRAGRPEKGMPAFASMSDEQLKDIAELLHVRVEDIANRGAYKVLNILVGNPAKGKAYVEGHCMSCHTEETFAHIASKFHSPEQLQRNWVWPQLDKNISASVETSQGTISGKVTEISDFRITLVDGSGKTHAIDRDPGVNLKISDPLAAHQVMVMTLENDAMHNVTAYLETLK